MEKDHCIYEHHKMCVREVRCIKHDVETKCGPFYHDVCLICHPHMDKPCGICGQKRIQCCC